MYFELYDNENSTYQNLWNADNAVSNEKFIVSMFILGDKKA